MAAARSAAVSALTAPLRLSTSCCSSVRRTQDAVPADRAALTESLLTQRSAALRSVVRWRCRCFLPAAWCASHSCWILLRSLCACSASTNLSRQCAVGPPASFPVPVLPRRFGCALGFRWRARRKQGCIGSSDSTSEADREKGESERRGERKQRWALLSAVRWECDRWHGQRGAAGYARDPTTLTAAGWKEAPSAALVVLLLPLRRRLSLYCAQRAAGRLFLLRAGKLLLWARRAVTDASLVAALRCSGGLRAALRCFCSCWPARLR